MVEGYHCACNAVESKVTLDMSFWENIEPVEPGLLRISVP